MTVTQQFLKETLTYHPDGYFIRLGSNKVVKPKIHSSQRYARISIHGKPVALHRMIFLYHHGYLPKCIDHIDNDRTNNKIENLREVTHSQNSLNKKHNKTSTAPYKGLNTRLLKDGISKSYEVYLSVNGKQKYFGRYRDPEEAKKVVIQAREKYHGEYANHGLTQGAIN